jgi:hypothetical protein
VLRHTIAIRLRKSRGVLSLTARGPANLGSSWAAAVLDAFDTLEDTTTLPPRQLKSLFELGVLRFCEMNLGRVIIALHRTCGVRSAIVQDSNLSINEGQHCGSDRYRRRNYRSRRIHGGIRRLEEKWPERVT